MKFIHKLLTSVTTLSILVFTSCGLEGEGDITQVSYEFAEIEGVDLEVAGVVYVEPSEVAELTIVGQQNIIDNLDLEIENGVLNIDFVKHVQNFEMLEFHIKTPRMIKKLEIDGSGKIFGVDTLKSESIDFDMEGSGMIQAIVQAKIINAEISGSGGIEIDGNVNYLSTEISGSGIIRANELEAKSAQASVSGSGSINLYVTEFLNAKISGSGDIYYRGNPQVTKEISGSGGVIKISE